VLHHNPKIKWPPWPKYGEEERIALDRVIKSNQLFADKEVRTFEEQYANFLGVKHCLGLGNATQALHLSLAALNIGQGDEVLVTSYSWISTASCILMQNAVPIFCDIESESLGICPRDMESKITPLTKAVIITHMFGYPAKIEQIGDICKKHGLPLIEDASHGHGAEIDGKKVGSYGDISVFSLHQRKSLSVGDGGLLCCENDEIAEKVYRLRSFGHDELSYNYRMTEFAGALGQCALAKLDKQNERRQENASYLAEKLNSSDKVQVRLPRENEKGVFHAVLLDILETWENSQNEISILQETGIPIRETWIPLHRHPHFNPQCIPARGLPWKHPDYLGKMRNISYKDLDLPVADNHCPYRTLELYVHPPCNINHLNYFIGMIFNSK
jgi:perosamine synthetase